MTQQVTQRLTKLRREWEAEGALGDLALVLADVCDCLSLADDERRAVLGESGAEYVEQWAGTPIVLNGKGAPVEAARQ